MKAEGRGYEREDDFTDNFIIFVLFSFLRFEPLVEGFLSSPNFKLVCIPYKGISSYPLFYGIGLVHGIKPWHE
jgi:hypothetical protein